MSAALILAGATLAATLYLLAMAPRTVGDFIEVLCRAALPFALIGFVIGLCL